MESNIEILRQRILPILLFCQANKGDLSLFDTWKEQEDAERKLFYAYYSGLFCRILVKMENESHTFRSFVRDCNLLLDKYNWYDIQEEDLRHFHADGSYACEVPDALESLDGIDNVVWKDSGFISGRDAICLKMDYASWTFADVKGTKSPQY